MKCVVRSGWLYRKLKSLPCVQMNFTPDLRFKCVGLGQSHAYMLQAVGLIPETKKQPAVWKAVRSVPQREHKTIAS